jgi:hypothetical protein
MTQNLMDVLMLGRCSHEFSWPRRTPGGDYYQVCLLCATAYEYDWKTMSRSGPLEKPVLETSVQRPRSGPRFSNWMPRARRIKLSGPLRYRGKNLNTWYEGSIQNISQSGVFFHGPQQLPVNAIIEMIFEMPEEISGQRNSDVLCQARLIRVKDAIDNTEDAFGLAASILAYRFLRAQLTTVHCRPRS